MTAVYQLRDLTRSYGARQALRVSDLTIEQGECVGIIGPSGAGKTTLLRVLAMLDKPNSGTLLYRGVLVNQSVPIETRREITMVFQRAALLDQSVRENVEYGLRIRGIADRDRVQSLLEGLGIDHLADQPAFSLSGGELQRTAVARALVIRPQVLLLDEPTANLDPDNVAILERAIQSAMINDGATVVLVSHNLHQVCRLATSVAGVLDGELVEHGPVQQIVHNAGNPGLRAFITGGIVY